MSTSLQRRVRSLVVLLIATAGIVFAGRAHAQHLYWSDSEGIHRANSDGSDGQILVPDARAFNLVLDMARGHIYWTIPGCSGWCAPWSPGRIVRANLDGTQVQTVWTDYEFDVGAFSIDSHSMKLYWGGPIYGDFIYDASLSSMNFNGSGMQRILATWPMAIAVDPVAQVLYWGEFPSSIRCVSLSDMTPCVWVGSVEVVYDLLVDAGARRLYWSEGERIMSSSLDGSGAEVVVTTGTPYALEIALDPIAGKIYWRTAGSGGADSIWRASLDGTGAEKVLDNQYIRGLAVDPRSAGDFNMDGHVDLRDFARISECLIGPGSIPIPAACTFFDVDPSDSDVDMADYATFQTAMTVPD